MNTAKVEHGAYHSSKVIPGRDVTIFDPHIVKPAPARVPVNETPTTAEPRVRLIKEGDVVTAIEIRCACGEITRLDCEY